MKDMHFNSTVNLKPTFSILTILLQSYYSKMLSEIHDPVFVKNS